MKVWDESECGVCKDPCVYSTEAVGMGCGGGEMGRGTGSIQCRGTGSIQCFLDVSFF